MLAIWFGSVCYKLKEEWIPVVERYCRENGIVYSALYKDKFIPDNVSYVQWELDDIVVDAKLKKKKI